MPAKASSSDFLLDRLLEDGEGPQLTPRCQLSSPEMTWTGMWRVLGSCLRRSRTTQPSMSGRRRSSVMASGLDRWASSRAISPREVIRPLKPIWWAIVEQDRGELGVVLDDEDEPVARLEVVAVAADVHLGMAARRPRGRRRRRARRRRGRESRAAGAAAMAPPRRGDADGVRGRGLVVQRQVEGEGAPLAGRAPDPDLAAEQAGDLPADRQAQARAAVLAAGPRVGLLERLEDDLQLVGGDADPRVGDREGHDPAGPAEHRVVGGPARRRPARPAGRPAPPR